MNARQGLVFTGGRAPAVPIHVVDRAKWFVVAADSGLEMAAEAGVIPDAIVGDMDSLRDVSLIDEYPDAVVERYPRAKDFTDTEIACRYIRDIGIDSITIVGGGGGRLDHLLAVSYLFHRVLHPRRWLTHREEVLAVDDSIVLSGRPGETISLLPVGQELCRMRSRGLRWALDSIEWTVGDIGISNECTAEQIRIDMECGRLILIRSLPAEIEL